MTRGRTRRGPRSINADDSSSEEELAAGGPGPGAVDPVERGVLTDPSSPDTWAPPPPPSPQQPPQHGRGRAAAAAAVGPARSRRCWHKGGSAGGGAASAAVAAAAAVANGGRGSAAVEAVVAPRRILLHHLRTRESLSARQRAQRMTLALRLVGGVRMHLSQRYKPRLDQTGPLLPSNRTST